jgi:hypothetical protein
MDVDTFYPFGFYVVFLWCLCNFPMVFLWFYGFFGDLSLILWTCIGISIKTCINYIRKCFVYSKHINCCWSWPLLATLHFQNLVVHIQKTPCLNIWCAISWWDYCFNTLLGATNVKFHFSTIIMFSVNKVNAHIWAFGILHMYQIKALN